MQSDDNPDVTEAGGSPSPNAGGFFLAAGCIGGVIVGSFLGQPSIGFLAGLGLGGLVALAMWLRDRNR
ncbi:hypothetical protein SAMN02745824_0994 [Parasphingorhabdus marina DSM 22363]|uniref:Uncharacterized protein n=1 Tax=Parasphingorhabdus marina DSM 22363 TaxID=1123272 RepID=A0A1N6CU23_9SPHN|nr:hypothetical protein [Parasphingorhabdus marina]SIN62012.1 hypothetical protein SAMN02745824_0994 [Parasphingorhabdus marina DSM 22363]